MNIENADILGVAFLAMIALLSSYFLLLRIKEYFQEKPDPKTTYATREDLDKLRQQLLQFQRDNKSDHETLDDRRSRALAHIHALIRKNAEHIATLIAQTQMSAQRISELNIKTERMQERIK